MKKICRGLVLIIFIVSSFYFTDMSIKYTRNSSILMKEIVDKKDDYVVKPTNGLLLNNTIIPGLMGKEVNIDKSYNNMLKINRFDENYLIYDDIIPSISITNNKNKYIISGNKKYNEVSIILEDTKHLSLFNSYSINLLIDKESEYNNVELINNSKDKYKYPGIDRILSTGKELCIVNGNENLCKSHNKYLIKPSIVYYNRNSLIMNEIEKGSIILVKKDNTEEDILLLLNYLKTRDLKVVFLSNLICEKKN